MTISDYLTNTIAKHRSGDAGERSYYGILERFLTEYRPHTEVTIEKRNSKVGIPDFVVETAKEELLGYVEAKDVGRNLDNLNSTEQIQIKKYIKEYPKLILTNFIEFRLFERGKEIDRAIITLPVSIDLNQVILQDEARFQTLLDRFFGTTIPKTVDARQLAVLLADRAKALKSLTLDEINLEDDIETDTEKLYSLLKNSLKPTLTIEEFADVYAQTIVFGLFVARINSGSKEFVRQNVQDYIPKTIPLLRQLFKVLSVQDTPQHIRWQMNQVIEILAKTDVERVAKDFFSHGKERDPIVHFFETFLTEYDPKQRERLGVYYTPDEVVSFITRSVEKILQTDFNKSAGFADPSVVLLDPAAGTLTFPAHAIKRAYETHIKIHGTGSWSNLVKNHILKNFYAFEYLMAPYTVGHLKIALTLLGLGYQIQDDDRFKLYLTNTLDTGEPNYLPHPQFPALTEEAKLALEVKKNVKVLVVMGNPPYSGHSASPNLFNKETDIYKFINGKSMGEKNTKWLKDDYVKFIRFAQLKIDQNGSGILGFITNHSWLDNPTFRGMRASLLETFDQLYILNLHGSSLKKEKTPAGDKDENVFDIQTGVAITIGIKNKSLTKSVKYADIWGNRKEKYQFLESKSINTVDWTTLSPSSPDNYLILRDTKGWNAYSKFPSITEIFNLNSVGIVTARDDLTIQDTPEKVWDTVNLFANMDPETARQAFKLGEDVRDWKVNFAQQDLKTSGLKRENIVPILYRPFDTKYTYYTGKSRGFLCMPRPEVMRQMLPGNNIALLIKRQQKQKFSYAFVSDKITESCVFESAYANNTVIPLYQHHKTLSPKLLDSQDQLGIIDEGSTREINMQKLFLELFQEFFGRIPPHEQIFYYIYAILYSNTYRQQYQEFLQRDFPRIPITKDLQLFQQVASLGDQLVNLHLLKTPDLDTPGHWFQGIGDSLVIKRRYDEKTQRVYINDTHYFEDVSSQVWHYHIGGYQVLDKWLKDRVGRRLSVEDQLHYRKIIKALEETTLIQEKIDKFYYDIEKTLT